MGFCFLMFSPAELKQAFELKCVEDGGVMMDNYCFI
jgi:hypothetical protein